ncbi:GPI-anchored protein LLG1-like [Cornus florida]|uniref:GPI-anchored protein LLG1-like n=1 Tax=Cornus florida TaxID=4283 RepID=UPI00289D0D73|nr:GPI-anchored protein LLG1-like [Cornus florida]
MKIESIDLCCSSNSSSSSSSVLVILFLFLFSAATASTYISDDIFGSGASTGRNLLQAKKACPVSFEFLNYTIITSQCEAPEYLPKLCCPAFKELACPYVDQLNDLTTYCSENLFSYINLHGNYTPGLFSTLCREGQEGIQCPASPPTQSPNAGGSPIICDPTWLLMLITAFLMPLLR